MTSSVAPDSGPSAALLASADASRTSSVASVGSLCSGYGGLDMGLELAVGPVRHAWHVEVDDAPAKILATRFPGVPNYGDLKTLDYAAMERVDILTAGYPCQPFSDAGLRKGADDPRHLWPYVADAIGHLRPRLVLLENVRGHVRRGLDCVIADLAALGYDASWGLVRASDAGAPHRRERIFIVAQDADEREGGQRHLADVLGGRQDAPEQAGVGGGSSAHTTGDRRHEGRTEPAWLVGGPDAAERGAAPAPDADGTGLEGREPAPGHDLPAWGLYEPAIRRWESITGHRAPWATEPRGRGGAERLSPRFVEWMMGLPAGWVTDVPGLSANEQLKALGNGVVPQQAALAVPVLLHNLAAPSAVAA